MRFEASIRIAGQDFLKIRMMENASAVDSKKDKLHYAERNLYYLRKSKKL